MFSTVLAEDEYSNEKPVKLVKSRLRLIGKNHATCIIAAVRLKHLDPATPREILEKKRREALSMNWAKPILEYQEEKRTRAEEREPHMIHVVTRVKTLIGRPWWEKDVCKEFGLSEKMHNPVPLKNTPEINKKLMAIKHLVEIKPLTFPHGTPEHESDFDHLVLKSNGALEVKKMLKDFDCPVEDSPEVKPRDKYKLTDQVLERHLDQMKKEFLIYEEYFKADYVYKHNQDGKEYRYKKYPYSVKKAG